VRTQVERRQQDLTRGKYLPDLSPAPFRDGYALMLLCDQSRTDELSREPMDFEDGEICARYQLNSAPKTRRPI
jgi:hypothetical protein